jgi:teichoic acid transport system permease protein
VTDPGPEPSSIRTYSDVEYVFEPDAKTVQPWREYVREIWERRAFVRELARASLRKNRSNTVLGELWALADPLFQAAIYMFLVTVLRGRGGSELLALIVSGVFLFGVTRGGLSSGGRSIIQGKGLMLNSTFPRALLPIAAIYKSLLEFIPAIFVYAVIHVVLGRPFGSGMLMLPFFFLLQVLMTTGFTLLVAALTVYVRDMANLLDYITRILFFTTPVIYPYESLGPLMRNVLSINPFFALFSSYQMILLGGTPTVAMLIQVLFWTIFSLVVGYRVFVSLERSFALRL